jgi:hypothetical protein
MRCWVSVSSALHPGPMTGALGAVAAEDRYRLVDGSGQDGRRERLGDGREDRPVEKILAEPHGLLAEGRALPAMPEARLVRHSAPMAGAAVGA